MGIEVEGRGGHHLGGWVTLPDAILELNYSILGVKSQIEINFHLHLVGDPQENLAVKFSLLKTEWSAEFPHVDELNFLLNPNNWHFIPFLILGHLQFEQNILAFEIECRKCQVELIIFIELKDKIFGGLWSQSLIIGDCGFHPLFVSFSRCNYGEM